MSNHLAIATVTAVLRQRLQAALEGANPDIAGPRVTTVRPNAPAEELPALGINVFLYQVTPNPALRNHDTPTRGANGAVLRRPQAALELHYLLSFHGKDSKLEPQILHGVATRFLHENPEITREAIEATLTDTATFGNLAGSDLASALELPRITPTALSVEEMSKLWSVFFQTPYVLSAAYRVSVVLLDGETRAQSAPRVRTARVNARAALGARIDAVHRALPSGAIAPDQPIVAGAQIALVGDRLKGPVTRVRFGRIEVTPEPTAVTETRITVSVPDVLQAGVHGVQAVIGRGAQPSPLDVTSNLAAFVLAPTITVASTGTDLRVGFAPAIGRTQALELLLNEASAPAERPARAYRIKVPDRPTGDRAPPSPASSLDVPIPDVAAGTYLVRVEVDGAESRLEPDPATGTYVSPRVAVP